MKGYEDRVLFLKQFTKEMILQSKPAETEIEHAGELIEVPILKEIEIKAEEKIQPLQMLPKPSEQRLVPVQISPVQKPLAVPTSKSPAVQPAVKPVQAVKPRVLIAPAYPGMIELGKLNILVQDPGVTMIECTGPEKIILVRSSGRTSMTNITLTQKEILDIINRFSERARIPVISGLFKAVVGNLIITAVISELVGNRFIISKIAPQPQAY